MCSVQLQPGAAQQALSKELPHEDVADVELGSL